MNLCHPDRGLQSERRDLRFAVIEGNAEEPQIPRLASLPRDDRSMID